MRAALRVATGIIGVLAVAAWTPGAAAAHSHAVRGGLNMTQLAAFRWKGSPVSPTAVPLGDGKVSTSARVGYVDSCTTTFGNPGAHGPTPWINSAAKTWNATTKPVVEGSVSWPSARFSISVHGANRVLTTNDLPKGLATGTFPIQPSDPAYQYDQNPNSIQPQTIRWIVPVKPKVQRTPECEEMGPIGFTTDGVLLFNALDGGGRDAVAHEIQDKCGGHPQQQGMYHYHTISACLYGKLLPGKSILVGYALDGFGIYVETDSKGNLPTDGDLDKCHGRTSKVLLQGHVTTIYHYDLTREYPYTVGCYRGSALQIPPG